MRFNFFLAHLVIGKAVGEGAVILHKAAEKTEEKCQVLAECLVQTIGSISN